MQAYQKYIEFEMKQKPVDAFRVRTLYERALVRHCLRPDVWTRYGDYLVRRPFRAASLSRVRAACSG